MHVIVPLISLVVMLFALGHIMDRVLFSVTRQFNMSNGKYVDNSQMQVFVHPQVYLANHYMNPVFKRSEKGPNTF